jgi:hypothetical protein
MHGGAPETSRRNRSVTVRSRRRSPSGSECVAASSRPKPTPKGAR